MKKVIAIIALLCLAFPLTACADKETPSSRPTDYDGKQSVAAILDYAARLEENGDYEAAAKVYALLPKAAAVEAVGAEKQDPAAQLIEDYMEAGECFDAFGK